MIITRYEYSKPMYCLIVKRLTKFHCLVNRYIFQTIQRIFRYKFEMFFYGLNEKYITDILILGKIIGFPKYYK